MNAKTEIKTHTVTLPTLGQFLVGVYHGVQSRDASYNGTSWTENSYIIDTSPQDPTIPARKVKLPKSHVEAGYAAQLEQARGKLIAIECFCSGSSKQGNSNVYYTATGGIPVEVK